MSRVHAQDAELSTLFQVLGRFPDVKLTPLGEVLRAEVDGNKKKVPKHLASIVLPPGLIFAADKGGERAAKLSVVSTRRFLAGFLHTSGRKREERRRKGRREKE